MINEKLLQWLIDDLATKRLKGIERKDEKMGL